MTKTNYVLSQNYKVLRVYKSKAQGNDILQHGLFPPATCIYFLLLDNLDKNSNNIRIRNNFDCSPPRVDAILL